MLPDFPSIKRELKKVLSQFIDYINVDSPILSEIRKEKHYEGSGMSIDRENGEVEKTNYKEISSQLVIKNDDLIEKGFLAVLENFKNVATEFNKQMSKMLYEEVESAAKKSGNIIEAGGKEFNFDMFIEMLEKIGMDFDDNGFPILPTISTGDPVLFNKIKDKFTEWENNPEYKKRFQELIKRKKEEWDAKESSRKLVD